LESHGFSDLLERITYLRDAEHQQQGIIAITRSAKAQADAATRQLTKLEASDRQITADTAIRAQALAGMNSLLQSKQAALKQAQAVQQSALSASRTRGSQLQAQISQIEALQAAQQGAQQAQQPVASSGPALGASGGWVIPYAIVLCESGGQKLPPNGAGCLPGEQVRAGRGRLPDLEWRRGRVQLGLRRNGRDPLAQSRGPRRPGSGAMPRPAPGPPARSLRNLRRQSFAAVGFVSPWAFARLTCHPSTSTCWSSAPACRASARATTFRRPAPRRPTRSSRPGTRSVAPGTCSAIRAFALTRICTRSDTRSARGRRPSRLRTDPRSSSTSARPPATTGSTRRFASITGSCERRGRPRISAGASRRSGPTPARP